MSYTPDLNRTEWWHAPDLGYSESLPEKFDAIMVGWLGDRVPTTGEISPETITKHDCEICMAYTDRAEILIIDDNKMYAAPRMILHDIKKHAYRPPQPFLDAVDKLDLGEI